MGHLRHVADFEGAELEALRIAYESRDETVAVVCGTYRISVDTLHKLIHRHRWRPRQPRRIDPHDVVERLLRLLDRQITELESDMNKTGPNEAAVLGRLVSTLDRLIGMKKAESKPKPKAEETKEISDIKTRLIERIEQLKRG